VPRIAVLGTDRGWRATPYRRHESMPSAVPEYRQFINFVVLLALVPRLGEVDAPEGSGVLSALDPELQLEARAHLNRHGLWWVQIGEASGRPTEWGRTRWWYDGSTLRQEILLSSDSLSDLADNDPQLLRSQLRETVAHEAAHVFHTLQVWQKWRSPGGYRGYRAPKVVTDVAARAALRKLFTYQDRPHGRIWKSTARRLGALPSRQYECRFLS
jgi:hypothetical protein